MYYKAEVNGYVFGKTEIVALVELMLLLNEVMVAKTVLDHTRLLFSVPPDSLWFEHTLFRCNFIVNNGDAKTIYPHEPHSIFRIAEDFIKPSDMSVVVKTYIVERDITMCFENKVGVLESELPCEEECLAINNLSLTLTRNSTLLTQGEFHSTTDFFIGPMGLNLINLGRDHLVAIKTQRFEVYDGEFAPFLLSSAGISNYWHALIDSLPRLVHLQDEQPIILMGEPSSEIVALIKLLKPRSKIFTYSHSGALLNRVVRSHLSVITKEPFWDGERPCFDVSTLLKFRSELLKSFEEMSADKSKFRADKVFLIRNSTHRRSEIENLKELLEGQGFVSIDPSVLSIPEQAKLFSTAKVVVGEVGAAWANLIFCTPGTQIFSLCAESSAPTPLFGGFAQILGLDFYSVAFPDAWIYDSENHWNNTPEAFFQSGFNLTDEHVARAANFILKSSILN